MTTCEGRRKDKRLLLHIALGTWMVSEFSPERKQGGSGLEVGNGSISNSLLHMKLDVRVRRSALLLQLELDARMHQYTV